MTFRTTFRETLSSRQIALIDLPCTKNARRIFAIVSTISIPTSASIIMEASVDPQPRGPDWMPITPKTGSLFHAETQLEYPKTAAVELAAEAVDFPNSPEDAAD